VDTAWPYHGGQSEPLVGKAIKNGYREKVKVATKLPSWMIKTRADMDRYLKAQLEKLDIDCIDYYLLHTLTGDSWDILYELGVLDFLEQAKNDGRIVNAGFSFHGILKDFKRIIDAYPWVFCQIQYNYLDQKNQAGTEGLKYAAGKDIGVIVMEPLRGGSLGLNPQPPAIDAILRRSPVKRTPVDWALRWVWNHPEVTVVLSGMNEESHIDENIAIAENAYPNTMTADELAMIESVSRKYHELLRVGCTGCGYCMPCPSNVTIPICFEEYNKMRLFGSPDEVKFRYALRMSGQLIDGNPGYASQCVRCGLCLDKCPQQIPIPDFLAEIAEQMEGPELQARIEKAKQIFKVEAK